MDVSLEVENYNTTKQARFEKTLASFGIKANQIQKDENNFAQVDLERGKLLIFDDEVEYESAYYSVGGPVEDPQDVIEMIMRPPLNIPAWVQASGITIMVVVLTICVAALLSTVTGAVPVFLVALIGAAASIYTQIKITLQVQQLNKRRKDFANATTEDKII